LGFNDLRKFVLLDDPNDDIFAWLQSCEVPQIAFPVLEPELFATGYNVSLTKHDLESLNLSKNGENSGTRAFSIITIPEDPTQMTANLKAPIVINVAKRMARQIVLQDNQWLFASRFLQNCKVGWFRIRRHLLRAKGLSEWPFAFQ